MILVCVVCRHTGHFDPGGAVMEPFHLEMVQGRDGGFRTIPMVLTTRCGHCGHRFMACAADLEAGRAREDDLVVQMAQFARAL